jgi:putative glutamine amidotransferase
MKPVIGITTGLADQEWGGVTYRRTSVSIYYAQAVHAAGGIPVVLPPVVGAEADHLATIGGLVLSGGADVDPIHYGEAARHPETYGIDETRDAYELTLVRLAFERDLPTLGICRGIQMLNVGLGGTLHQHMPDLSDLVHSQKDGVHNCYDPSHRVSLTADTPLARIFGSAAVEANTYHHQAIKDVAPALAIAGVAEDGTVEAVYAPGKASVIGVQWHPEMMFAHHDQQLAPFIDLVANARARMATPAR